MKTCADQLDKAMNEMGRKLSGQEALIKNIDKAILFYTAQQKEAAVVTNVSSAISECLYVNPEVS